MSNLYWMDKDGSARGQKVLLATTAYDSPDASYTVSIEDSRAALRDAGIQTAYCLLSGNCHVDDARNTVVAQFLRSDCTDLVFLDADVSWKPADLVRLCSHEVVDVVGGVYPKRSVTAEDMPVRMIPGETTPDSHGLLSVEGLPTGFLRIRRIVLQTLADRAQGFRKGTDPNLVPIVFERDFVEGVGRRGGDIGFCMKAIDQGFSVKADCDLVLGHAAKTIIKGSLGQALRKQKNETIAHVARKVRERSWVETDIQEAIDFIDNGWGAQNDALIAAIKVLESSPGDVIETGSGLSTVLMAAAVPDHRVYALEHDPLYFETTKRIAKSAGIKNIGLVLAPIDPVTNWYDTSDFAELPDAFALGFVDGPPRAFGSRMEFFEDVLPFKCSIIIADDANDLEYKRKLHNFADCGDFHIAFEDRVAIMKDKMKD